jgi:hypothetical protein
MPEYVVLISTLGGLAAFRPPLDREQVSLPNPGNIGLEVEQEHRHFSHGIVSALER